MQEEDNMQVYVRAVEIRGPTSEMREVHAGSETVVGGSED